MRSADPDPLLAELTGTLLGRLDQLADEMTDRIRHEIEMYRNDTIVSRAELLAVGRENIERALTQLTHHRAVDLTAAQNTGRLRAQQDAPLPEVIRAFRIGYAFLWERLLATSRAAGPDHLEALIAATSRFWMLNDEHSTAVTEAYRTEVTARTVARDRHRSALVASLTQGNPRDGQTAWETAKTLGMPFEGVFLVVAIESTGTDDPVVPRTEERLHLLGVTSAWHALPDRDIGILACGRRPSRDVLAVLEASTRTRVGVSPPYGRLDLTYRATRNAHIALESLAPGSAGVAQLADTPLIELVAGNLDASRHVARRVLADVLTLPREDRDIELATAEAWLKARGSAIEAGRMLYCHQNTVRHRIRRLEGHLGRSLDDPATVAELTIALQALHLFPELTTDDPTASHADPPTGTNALGPTR